MKRIFFISMLFLAPLLWRGGGEALAQTYGGEIRGLTNGNVIGKIGRVDVNLKVYDSAMLALFGTRIPTGLTVTSTRLLVDGSGVTQPVSGTFWQATQPVSAASLPLPTGASTSANQTTTNGHLATLLASQKAEDVGSNPADPGLIFLAVRNDASATITDADGDYTAIVADNTGRIVLSSSSDISVRSSFAPVSTLNHANAQGGVISTTAAVFDDVSPTAITENNFGYLRMSNNRNLYGTIRDAAGNERGVNVNTSNELLVALSSLPAGTNNIGDVDILTIAAGDNNIGNMDIVTMPSVTIGTFPDNEPINIAQMNGVAVTMGNGTSGTGVQRVVLASDPTAISTTGYMSVKFDQTTPGTTNGVVPAGNVAHDAGDAGNPIKIGAKAETSPAGITTVADADRTDLYADADGLQMMKMFTSFADIKNENVTNTNGTSTAFSNFGAVASTRNYITTIVVYNSSATAGTVDFRDGTAGSVLFTAPIPAGGGSAFSFTVPLRQPTANTALAYDVSGALSTVTISVIGFQSKL